MRVILNREEKGEEPPPPPIPPPPSAAGAATASVADEVNVSNLPARSPRDTGQNSAPLGTVDSTGTESALQGQPRRQGQPAADEAAAGESSSTTDEQSSGPNGKQRALSSSEEKSNSNDELDERDVVFDVEGPDDDDDVNRGLGLTLPGAGGDERAQPRRWGGSGAGSPEVVSSSRERDASLT